MLDTARVIEISNLHFAYPQIAPLFEGISFNVNEEEFLAIIGPNGGGKTTLLKLILGLLVPSMGTVRVLNRQAIDLGFERRLLGYVPQNVEVNKLYPATVMDVTLLGTVSSLGLFRTPGKRECDSAREALHWVGLEEFEHHRAATLSGGQRQRLAIARALVTKPKLLLMDEPTSALDIGGQTQLFDMLARLREHYRLTVVMVSHDILAMRRHADTLVCIRKKITWHGKRKELTESILDELYDS